MKTWTQYFIVLINKIIKYLREEIQIISIIYLDIFRKKSWLSKIASYSNKNTEQNMGNIWRRKTQNQKICLIYFHSYYKFIRRSGLAQLSGPETVNSFSSFRACVHYNFKKLILNNRKLQVIEKILGNNSSLFMIKTFISRIPESYSYSRLLWKLFIRRNTLSKFYWKCKEGNTAVHVKQKYNPAFRYHRQMIEQKIRTAHKLATLKDNV